jgi:short-subunit dehydrogenase
MRLPLFGKSALVTGASSGIGRALAKELDKEGVVLAVSARRGYALESLADEIERDGGKRPVVLPADLSKLGALAPMPLGGHYCSSKAALSLASETLRLELRGSGVHVFNVQPGPVDTGMLAEVGAVPGGDAFLAHLPRDAEMLARKIVRGLQRGQRSLVYPSSLAMLRHLPTVALRATAIATRSIDVDDPRMLRGGSQGDAPAVAARSAFERSAAG